MRVALIDPSLFTLPYDAGLVIGLRANGHEATLYGRPLTEKDGDPSGVHVEPSFYRFSAIMAEFPASVRLTLKGLDHGFSLLRLLRRLRRDRPDIIHFQWVPLPALDTLLMSRFRRIAPVVLTVHDTNPFNGNPTARLQRVGYKSVLAACDFLVVHTKQGEARLRAMGIGAEKIVVIPHGTIRPVLQEAAGADEDGGLEFVLFGKIKRYKGADLLIDAFAALPDALRRQARVRIIGQAYMNLDSLRQQACDQGIEEQVSIQDRFVSDDEVGGLFAENSVAVFPYREIEASGVLFVAIRQGRPIIASKIGAFAEALTHDVHGCLIPAEDTAALTAAMARMIKDRAFMRSCAASVAALSQQTPDWIDVGRMTGALYEAILAGRKRVTVERRVELATGIAS